MVKILCIGSFLVGLLATAISYTVDYFSLEEKIEQGNQELIKNEL